MNLKKHFSESHDYILCYAKNINKCINNGLQRADEANSRYSNPDNDMRGVWKSSDLSVGPAIESKIYEITTPSGRKVLPPSGYCWRLSKERFDEFVKENRIWFGQDGNNVPSIKRFLSEVKNTITPMTIWKYKDVGHSQEANQSLKKLFDGKAYFDYPKPLGLIERIIELYTSGNDIVLDFFAGSGTTGHAVIKSNQEKGLNNKFILIQLPEPLSEKDQAYKDGISKVSQITKLRLNRALNESNSDAGFRSFYLDDTNIRPWDADFDNLELILKQSEESIKPGRNPNDVLFEILLKYGIDLTFPINEKSISQKIVYIIGDGALVVCLDDNLTIDNVQEISSYINGLDAEFTQVVFRDSAFKTAVDKVNSIQILKQNNITDVKSI